MNVNSLIDELLDVLEKSWRLPLSGGRSVVDPEKVKDLVDKIRTFLPNEIKQAQSIVADRTQIINDAKQEAESIVRSAEEKARTILSKSEMVRQAKLQSDDMITQAQLKSRSLKKAANDYVDDILKSTDDLLAKSLMDFRKTRQSIRSSQKNQ